MRTPLTATLTTLLAGAMMTVAGAANAYGDGTPDQQPPAEEHFCEDAGLFGAAFGLCVAYCEANDCDQFDQPDNQACSALRERYARATGQLFFPCDVPPGDS
jgi:hypothetical protein